MSHMDEAMLLAIRDGELVIGDGREHLSMCGRCHSLLEELERRAQTIGDALAELDRPVELDRARAAVRARLDAARDADRSGPGRLWAHLGRAAAILLLVTGAVYAMPGSPLRDWLASTGEEAIAPGTVPVATTVQETEPEGGIEVDLAAGVIRIVLSGVQPGTDVEVVWTERSTARIVAAAGTSFTFGEGRAEAVVTPGPVRVELPEDARSVSVDVDGRTYLRRSVEGLQVLVPAVEHSARRLRFVAPER